MKIAVISDIHGNRLALEAVLKDIARESVDSTLCLGDLVSGPLEPNWSADILMGLDIPIVRGNHDRVLFEPPPEGLHPIDKFARDHMDERHLTWLSKMPATMAMLDEIFLCHGTPVSDEQPWLDGWWDGRTSTMPSEASVTAAAEGLDYPVLLCGHTHVPRAVRLADGRLIINPGAVGLQFNIGLPDARYALIERRDGKWSATHKAVPYDWEAAARLAEANGFAYWRDALVGGWAPANALF